jgi:multidrug transporter EmrE-like cation transporter
MNTEFFKSLSIIHWYFIAMIFYAIGEILSKYWGIKPTPILGIAVMTAYMIGIFCWLGIMIQKNQLALMSCIWQVLTTGISIAVGTLYFHEKLATSQWFGIVLALVGLFLLTK